MQSLLVQWKNQISDDSPFGEDCTFSEEFDAIRLEVDKSTSIHAEESPNWSDVLEQVSTMLGETSKDLWLFWYGCRAALEIHGLAGFADALETTKDFTLTHWKEIFPVSTKHGRRAAPFNWFVSQTESYFSMETFASASVEVNEKIKTSLLAIQKVLDAELGDNAPSLRGIIRLIPEQVAEQATKSPANVKPKQNATAKNKKSAKAKTIANTPETEETAEESQPSEQAASAPATSPAVFPATDMPKMSDSSLTQLIRNTSDTTRQLAGYFLGMAPTDWKSFMLHRAILWGSILQLPDANADDVTQVRPPSKERIQEYTNAFANGQYGLILNQLEKTAAHAPFWFDGHHMVVQCLQQLHAPMSAKIIEVSLHCFLSKFSQLTSYCFFDKTPFASETTKEWIAGFYQQKADSSSLFLSATESSDTQHNSLLASAFEVMEKKGFREAFHAFDAMPLTKSRQGVLNALLKIRFCLLAGKPQAALSLATITYKKLEDWGAVEWEPELSAQLLALIIQSKTLPEEQRVELTNRLHWLHMETALAVGTE